MQLSSRYRAGVIESPVNARRCTSNMLCLCLHNVSRQERMMQKLSAPAVVRPDRPFIHCLALSVGPRSPSRPVESTMPA